MGKISKVFYGAIDSEVCSTREAGEYYYHYNLLHTHEMFQKSFEDYEAKQIELRNKIVAEAIKSGEIPNHPIMNSTIFGVSTMKQTPVVITEY